MTSAHSVAPDSAISTSGPEGLREGTRLKASILATLSTLPPLQWSNEIAGLLERLLDGGPHHPIALFTLLSELADSVPALMGAHTPPIPHAFPTFSNISNATLPAAR